MTITLLNAAHALFGRLLPRPAPSPEAPVLIDEHAMEIFYDVPRDTLYISLGGPRESIASELVGDLLIRYAPKSDRIIGLTILNLSRMASPTLLPVLMTLRTLPEAIADSTPATTDTETNPISS